MSTPEQMQEHVTQQLADGLDVTGTVQAGIYGDPAGASAPPAELDLSKATPTVADVEALRERLAAMEAAQAAAAVPPEPEPDNTLRLDANAPSFLHELVAKIEARLQAGGL